MANTSHRALAVATLFAIAGCGSSTGQSSLAPAGAIWPAHRSAAVTRAIHSSYSTKNSLLFVSDFSNGTVNIYRTSRLESNPAPIATIAEPPGGCPYQMAFDSEGDLYLADECLNRIEIHPKGSTRMSRTITNGAYNPFGVAIDKGDTLYVSRVPLFRSTRKAAPRPPKP